MVRGVSLLFFGLFPLCVSLADSIKELPKGEITKEKPFGNLCAWHLSHKSLKNTPCRYSLFHGGRKATFCFSDDDNKDRFVQALPDSLTRATEFFNQMSKEGHQAKE